MRRWAAPVVLTFALAPAACAKDKTTDEKTSNPPDITDNTKKPDPKVPTPDPNGDKVPKPVAADAGTATKIAKAIHLGDISRTSKDGPCEVSFNAHCDPHEKCNPPPPREIECGDIPNDNRVSGEVFKSAEGVCTWEQDVKCPPNVPCNPPAPKVIPCPDK